MMGRFARAVWRALVRAGWWLRVMLVEDDIAELKRRARRHRAVDEDVRDAVNRSNGR